MANPELGTKRICAGCNVKFYDLNKTPIVCPACATVFALPKPAAARPRRAFEPPPAPVRAVSEVADVPAEKDDGDDLAAAGVPVLEEMDEDDGVNPTTAA